MDLFSTLIEITLGKTDIDNIKSGKVDGFTLIGNIMNPLFQEWVIPRNREGGSFEEIYNDANNYPFGMMGRNFFLSHWIGPVNQTQFFSVNLFFDETIQ